MFLFLGDLLHMFEQESSGVGDAVVAFQEKVHGRDIIQGWVLLMVTEILLSIRQRPPEYPTHSDEVESGSFVPGMSSTYAGGEKSGITVRR